MSAAWPTARIGDVLSPVAREQIVDPSREYPLLGVRLDGQGPFHRETVLGTQTSASRLYEVRAGDFIYSRLFAWRGAFGLIEPQLDAHFVSNEFPTFTPINGQVDPKFLRYWFRLPDVLRRVEADCSGSTPLTRNRYKEQYFFALEIPLPTLYEQRRIVARIEELAAKVEEARRHRIDAAREFSTLYAKQLFSTFEPYASNTTTIGAEFVVTTGGTPSRANSAFWGGTNAWVSSGEVAFRPITATREKITDFGLFSSNAKIYPPGTVLLAMIGQGKTRGQCAILECPAATNQNVAAIHVTKTYHSPRYVYWWLFANYQKNRSSETGTAQPALSADRVKQIVIPLPERHHQDKIVAELDALQNKVDAVKALQIETAAELDAMLPAILDKAFKGEL